MIELYSLSQRQLQTEAARALAAGDGFNNQDLVQFNKKAHHDSHAWYRAVIEWYLDRHGGLPSQVGPASEVKLLLEDRDR